ncbi:sensor histidine kinase [Glaciibacter sp. 2TAF33]|uniref:sensor histidine kinase n=1 Tax=Glaciibacter sp. 2TAF33 TaxID=3233015 RepID=UPI003F926D55
MHESLTEHWSRISLRTKITGVTVLLLTLGLLVSGIGTMVMLRQYAIQQVDAQLQTRAQNIANPTATGLIESSTEYFVALYDEHGDLLERSWKDRPRDELPVVSMPLDLVSVTELNGQPQSLTNATRDTQFHAVAVPFPITVQGTYGTLVVAVSLQPTENTMAIYLTIFLGFGIGVVIVGALLTRLLVTTTFLPLREVERTAAAIADGDFSQRLGGATPNTEVGRLNRSLNTMLSRIDRAFKDRARTIDQMRRFVGDASHELRTPLVSVRGYAELYRMGALQTPEEVAQAMERIEKEAIRMGGLVEDLLELARLDEIKPLALAPVDLVPLARDAALDAMASSPGRTVVVVEKTPTESVDTVPMSAIELAHSTGEFVQYPPRDANGVQNGAGTPSGRGSGGESSSTGTAGRTAGSTGRGIEEAGSSAPRAATDAADAGAASVGGGSANRAAAQNLTGPISFAGATLARLRTRRPRRTDAPQPVPNRGPVAPEDAVRPIVLAEENKIRQVITNLMGNAQRFTAVETPIELEVSVDRRQQRASIAVVDHGEGIPPQIREKIFQRFWRADTSRTRETGGTGLGLAIVASIVASHNGSVEVEETPGGGATFRVWFPLADSPNAPRPIITTPSA